MVGLCRSEKFSFPLKRESIYSYRGKEYAPKKVAPLCHEKSQKRDIVRAPQEQIQVRENVYLGERWKHELV